MSGLDLTTALAHLLSDPDLRTVFRQDRRQAATRLGLRNEDLDTFVDLDESAVDAQAQGLLDKRFHEVCQLMPSTMQSLGERCRPLFGEYASRYWPAGHRRHLVDALQFCQHLRQREIGRISGSEVNWLRFLESQRRFAIHLVSDIMINEKPRRGVQILYRRPRGRPGEFFWYLNL